jgi:hypothetical protein
VLPTAAKFFTKKNKKIKLTEQHEQRGRFNPVVPCVGSGSRASLPLLYSTKSTGSPTTQYSQVRAFNPNHPDKPLFICQTYIFYA